MPVVAHATMAPWAREWAPASGTLAPAREAPRPADFGESTSGHRFRSSTPRIGSDAPQSLHGSPVRPLHTGRRRGRRYLHTRMSRSCPFHQFSHTLASTLELSPQLREPLIGARLDRTQRTPLHVRNLLKRHPVVLLQDDRR